MGSPRENTHKEGIDLSGGINQYAGASFGRMHAGPGYKEPDSPHTVKHFKSASPVKRKKTQKSSYIKKHNFAVAALHVNRDSIKKRRPALHSTLSDKDSIEDNRSVGRGAQIDSFRQDLER